MHCAYRKLIPMQGNKSIPILHIHAYTTHAPYKPHKHKCEALGMQLYT